MNVSHFMIKWRESDLTERSGSQQHFCDLCALLDHPKPADADPKGEWFTFEKGARKADGADGWADVWKKGYFAWEYKGKHKDLDAAYKQLLQYREALESPPLLVVCDMDRIVVHTNFTATPAKTYELRQLEFKNPDNLEIIRAVFHDPEKLRPGITREAITKQAAARLAGVAETLRQRGLEHEKVARFLDRIVFCLFAEDIGLLPEGVFSDILKEYRDEPEQFTGVVEDLFHKMATGGHFGPRRIKYFNGNLFENVEVLPLEYDEIQSISLAAKLDWSAVDASVFGTLFERGMDPAKRSQLGAHYTSREDIGTLVEPVVMAPLRREWDDIRNTLGNLLTTGKKQKPAGGSRQAAGSGPEVEPLTGARLRKARDEGEVLVNRFLQRLTRVKVLDPACGSGNFLYVTLQKLKDLEKEVVLYADSHGLGDFKPAVGPWQLHGIELNPYACELAQLTIWIGYLQWLIHNGFDIPHEPILTPMHTFECKDAILDLSDPDHPTEPTWPKVDFIVGNPPFLGDKKMRTELGDQYVVKLRQFYGDRIPGQSDLCCYWFEKARTQIDGGRCDRAGLLGTQAIRGGANRKVLDRIKASGGIFFAESDRPWVLDGASVHVAMLGFDNGSEEDKVLDGKRVNAIHANVTADADVTAARRLSANRDRSFIGAAIHGPFRISEEEAIQFLTAPNPSGSPNSDVVRLWANGLTITKRQTRLWIIDNPPELGMAAAAHYEAPFEYLKREVYPVRSRNRRAARARLWWILGDPQKAMRAAVRPLRRFVAAPRVAKHRLYVWLPPAILATDQVVVFALDDHVSLGVLHSRLHEAWVQAQATQLRERQSGLRYTTTTCFETFPFPEPTAEQAAAIAEAARELNELRENWLNPPDWTTEEVLEFPGTVGGPWTRYIEEEGCRCSVVGCRGPEHRAPSTDHRSSPPRIGTVRYPRLVPKDAACAKRLKKRTLTNLYNERPTWLDLAHRKLDAAIFAAYGWDPAMGDEEVLEKLLALNLERADNEGSMR